MDRDQTLSEFVADAPRAQLQVPAALRDRRPGGLGPVPVLFVRDMRAALSSCRALGLRPHAADTEGEQRVELAFETHGPLEPIAGRLTEGGFEVGDIVDEGFGRSLGVREPHGLAVQLNELDREIYT